ncbi:MAG: alpha/beta hydrolase [Bacteroidetes bacterium]|nr:alpha/beta hydrolase [Bacteroidota bacterium]
MSLLLFLILLALTFLLTVSALVFVIGPIMMLHPRRRSAEFYEHRGEPTAPNELDLTYDEFFFTAADNKTKLAAWFIPAEKPKATIIYLHGVGDNKISGLLLAKIFHNNQFNVLLYDSRAHGKSGGNYCTYGYYEKYDVQKAIDAVKERGEKHGIPIGKIGVFGTSMGAAIAVQAASIEPMISAVISEACFATLRQITVDYQKRLLRLPWHFLRNISMKRSEKIAKFKHREVSPLSSVGNIHVPIFFIHGIEDKFIKYQYSQELFVAANEPKELWFVAAANHNNVYEVGKKEYEKRVIKFFTHWLKSSQVSPE